jgi:hypothetical protein
MDTTADQLDDPRFLNPDAHRFVIISDITLLVSYAAMVFYGHLSIDLSSIALYMGVLGASV